MFVKESMSLTGYASLVRRLRRCQEEFFRAMIDPREGKDHRLLHLIGDRLALESAVDAATHEILDVDEGME